MKLEGRIIQTVTVGYEGGPYEIEELVIVAVGPMYHVYTLDLDMGDAPTNWYADTEEDVLSIVAQWKGWFEEDAIFEVNDYENTSSSQRCF